MEGAEPHKHSKHIGNALGTQKGFSVQRVAQRPLEPEMLEDCDQNDPRSLLEAKEEQEEQTTIKGREPYLTAADANDRAIRMFYMIWVQLRFCSTYGGALAKALERLVGEDKTLEQYGKDCGCTREYIKEKSDEIKKALFLSRKKAGRHSDQPAVFNPAGWWVVVIPPYKRRTRPVKEVLYVYKDDAGEYVIASASAALDGQPWRVLETYKKQNINIVVNNVN